MNNIEVVIVLLAIITILAEITDKIKIPYPILLVLAGIGIGLIPGLPAIQLNPDLIFLIFLPPLLYQGAWSTSWADFKAARRPIFLLALGCVLFTTTAVAFIAFYLIPGFTWPVAFLLGAIISPPDAVAATAITKGLGVPKRVVTILEGESLVNDATGLIAYRYAIAAIATGNFILWQASLQFIWVAGAGIVIGLLVGRILVWIHKITPDNPVVDTSMTFITPFIAYLISEKIHVSGVLAVVVSGLYISWHSSELFSQQSRLQATAVWNTVTFLLNSVIFILIGLQLPQILNGIIQHSFAELIWYSTIVSLVVIVGRIIWVFPAAYIPRWISKKIRDNEPATNIKGVTIVAWTGMRGVVSLAAALALPLTLESGAAFPHRNVILFITFCVIFSTLVLQGLSLPPLVRWLGFKKDDSAEKEEWDTRLKIAYSAIEYIETNLSYGVMSEEVLSQIKNKYEIRVERMRKHIGMTTRLDESEIRKFHEIQQQLLTMERKLVIEMRKEARISDEVLRRIEYELDLEESRLLLDGETTRV